MNCIEIALKHIRQDLWDSYFVHSVLVTQMSLEIAENLNLDEAIKQFIREAAMLHDIGIGEVSMDKKNPQNKPPYITHGLVGFRILSELGYPKHALVCRNHIGVGLTKEIILRNGFPLPAEDMTPSTLPEEIITYADLFFSKSNPFKKRSFAEVVKKIETYGQEQLDKFHQLHKKFSSLK